MSTLSVSQITTGDNTTPLLFTTGNGTSGFIKVETANDQILFSGTPRFTGAISGVAPTEAFTTANAGFTQANTARTHANAAFGQANTATTNAGNAFGQANTARNHANSAFGQANTALTTAVAAFAQANTVPSAATQADQETATSTTTYVSPGRQHFHPSAAKFWAHFDTSGNLLSGYNVTSITDGGGGNATVVIATDFGTADYCVGVSIENNDATIDSVTDGQMAMIANAGQLAGSVQVINKNDGGTASADPTTWNVWGFGDLA